MLPRSFNFFSTSENSAYATCKLCNTDVKWIVGSCRNTSNMTKHLKEQHSESSRYPSQPYCAYCNKYFARSDTLRRHIRTSEVHYPKKMKMSAYKDKIPESVIKSTDELSTFLSSIISKKDLPTILPMTKALQMESKYRILSIRAMDTKLGLKQVWNLQQIGDTEVTEVWAPYSASKHIMNPMGQICEKKKSLMMQLLLLYKGYEGPASCPTRYKFDFVKS